MTQLDFITWPSQIIWLILIFHVIYFYIYDVFGKRLYLLKGYRSKGIKRHIVKTAKYESKATVIKFKRFSSIFNNF
jgi:hypothetical protein